MLVVNRFSSDADDFRDRLQGAMDVLAVRPGCEEIRAGRSLDDPALWVLVTRWADVGSYRRALSSYEVKVGAVPLLGEAIDEPSAFEDLDGELNVVVPRSLG